MRLPCLPYRSRSGQVAAYLKDQIKDGAWSDHLPAERLLAQQIGVSRATLREALNLLQQDGWAVQRSRLGTKVGAHPRRRTIRRPLSIGLFLPIQMDHLYQRTILWMDDLRRILYARKIELQVYQREFATEGAKTAFFKRIAGQTKHDCWVLPYSNAAMQEWCMGEKIRAVVIGALHEGCMLPNVAFDYRASCHHATTRILGAGHRELAIILDKQPKRGSVESYEAMEEAVHQANTLMGNQGISDNEARLIIARHNGSVEDLCRLADKLLSRNPRPTAWLVGDPSCFLTILTHLQQRGISIPREISLVCRDADPYLANCIPEPTRYIFDIRALARQVGRIAQKVAAHGTSENNFNASERTGVIPDFKLGQTLGPAPS